MVSFRECFNPSEETFVTKSEPQKDLGAEAVVARGHGRAKLILFGEHAVVYGKPAVAAGLPRGATATVQFSDAAVHQLTLRSALDEDVYARVECGAALDNVGVDAGDGERLCKAFAAILGHFDCPKTLQVDVTIEVPMGVGLGSSAALSVAVARGIGQLLGQPEQVDEAVDASERVFHGNPSGLDQMMAASKSGVYFYARAYDSELEVAPIEAPALTLAVCEAGPAASTAAMVEMVAQRRLRESQLIDSVNQVIGDTARAASAALTDGDWARVGELMDINHGALSSLGVTTRAIDAACHVARGAGALGAKLTGAGGGGCVVALTPGGAEDVLKAWAEHGWSGFEVTIDHRSK